MASRTISLDQAAYEKLKAAKRPGESFSQVVKRLTGKRTPNLLDLVGALPPEAAQELDRATRQRRADQAKIQEERHRRLWPEE